MGHGAHPCRHDHRWPTSHGPICRSSGLDAPVTQIETSARNACTPAIHLNSYPSHAARQRRLSALHSRSTGSVAVLALQIVSRVARRTPNDGCACRSDATERRRLMPPRPAIWVRSASAFTTLARRPAEQTARQLDHQGDRQWWTQVVPITGAGVVPCAWRSTRPGGPM